MVMMRVIRLRRTRTAESRLAETVDAGCPDGRVLRQTARGRGDVVQHPMRKRTGWRVRIVADHRDAFRVCRNAAPFDRWRSVPAVAGVRFRNRLVVRERG